MPARANLDPPKSDAPAPDGAAITVFDPLCSVFRRKLRADGLKYTPERAHILDTVLRLHDASGIFEADRVLHEVRRSGFRVSKATVYRTLRLMLDAGIVQRVPFDDDQSHYQLVFGNKPQDLLIRVDTGQAIPIDLPELAALRDALCRRLGLAPKGHRLQIFASER